MTKKKNPKGKAVMWTGDVDPFTYGGGIVYDEETGPMWVVFPGAEEELDEDDPTSKTQVYVISVEDDVLGWHDWVDVEKIASFTGADVEKLKEDARSPELARRVSVLEDIASYYGHYELDQYPQQMTEAELRKAYEADLDALHERERNPAKTRKLKAKLLR